MYTKDFVNFFDNPKIWFDFNKQGYWIITHRLIAEMIDEDEDVIFSFLQNYFNLLEDWFASNHKKNYFWQHSLNEKGKKDFFGMPLHKETDTEMPIVFFDSANPKEFFLTFKGLFLFYFMWHKKEAPSISAHEFILDQYFEFYKEINNSYMYMTNPAAGSINSMGFADLSDFRRWKKMIYKMLNP